MIYMRIDIKVRNGIKWIKNIYFNNKKFINKYFCFFDLDIDNIFLLIILN